MKRAPIVQWGTPEPQSYKGILMRANPALHEEAFEVLRGVMAAGCRVIDVGSGQGAFAARLSDAGYAVTSVDKNVADFRADGVEFIAVDFDNAQQVAGFRQSHEGQFDVAIGMEVIEHVENPWEYCRLLLSLVRPGGLVLITTPNVESALSRTTFLFSGLFEHFSTEDYRGSGHINPMTMHELLIIADGVGAQMVSVRTLCQIPWLIASRRITTVLKSCLSAMVRPFMGRSAGGDIICAVLQKPQSGKLE